MKICTVCNEEKDLEEFAKKPKGVLGRSSDCKVCHRKRRNALYDDAEKARIIADKKKRVVECTQYVKELKSNSSCKCGYKGVALQFHHLRDKDNSISHGMLSGWSLDRLKKEIEKCEIMCANCHMEEHFS
jgi:hypothetical protein